MGCESQLCSITGGSGFLPIPSVLRQTNHGRFGPFLGSTSAEVHKLVCKSGAKQTLNLSKEIRGQITACSFWFYLWEKMTGQWKAAKLVTPNGLMSWLNLFILFLGILRLISVKCLVSRQVEVEGHLQLTCLWVSSMPHLRA